MPLPEWVWILIVGAAVLVVEIVGHTFRYKRTRHVSLALVVVGSVALRVCPWP